MDAVCLCMCVCLGQACVLRVVAGGVLGVCATGAQRGGNSPGDCRVCADGSLFAGVVSI